MFNVQASLGPAHILKPPFGSDLLKELESFVREKGINLAWLSGIGAVSRATIRYYDQAKKDWVDLELDQRLEVVSMMGNVSLLNGEPIVHLHVVLADEQGRCYGGHLGNDTLVFNLEILMNTLSGPSVIRKMDAQTGLTIWH
jgi:predicted DNA-binding protein with PD1-like motif